MASSRRLPVSYNVSTYGAAGQGRDYTSLATWEVATGNNLVTATKGEVLECYDDAATFNDSRDFYGAVTNSDYFRVIKPAAGQGHDGTPNNGVNFTLTTGQSMEVRESYFSIQDLIVHYSTGNCGIELKQQYSSAIGCIIKGAFTQGSFLFGDTNTYAINCLGIDGYRPFRVNLTVGKTAYLYNCTAVDSTIGFNSVLGTSYAIAKNCCACDCTTDFDGTWTKTTCYEGDTTVFANQAVDDYHLFHADSSCIDAGTDLSADATYAFDDDIDGDTRTRWDIGFDEGGPWGSRRMPLAYNTSTYGAVGFGRDYTALATWEAATDTNLVTATAGEVLECYDDAASFNDSVTIEGATTNTRYFRVIKPAEGQGHNGTPNNGVTFSISSGDEVFHIKEHSASIHDIIGQNTGSGETVFGGSTDYRAIFVGCIAFDSPSITLAGFGCNQGTTPHEGDLTYINCLALNCARGFRVNTDNTNLCYNCSAVDCGTGFVRVRGTCIAKNCIACDCTTDFDGSWTKTTCYEGDATVFVNQANDDCHLAEADTTCRGNGTDLSADGTYAFDDDIDGETRSAWDIGFDEYSVLGWSNIAFVNTIGQADIGFFMGIAKDNIAVIDSITV